MGEARMKREPPKAVLDAPPHSMWIVPRDSGVEIYIREDDFVVARYPARCSVDVQLGVWDDGRVICIALLVRLGAFDAGTFDRRINVADPVGLRIMQLLAVQPAIDVFLVTDRIARAFRCPNTLLDKAVEAVAKMRDRRPWSEEQFLEKQKQIDRLYPSSTGLWWAARQQDH